MFWFVLISGCWGTCMLMSFMFSRVIYCLRTLSICSAVASSVKVFWFMISPIILLLIIILSICWLSVYIEVAIWTASTEFICWLIALLILPNIATMFSLFFIDLIRSHMMSILAAVLWKLMAEDKSWCTLVFLLRGTHQVHFGALFIILLQCLFGLFHVLLTLLFRFVGGPSYLLRL